MLDEPRINFAISTRGGTPGIDHLGFQTDNAEELAELKARAQAADLALLDEGATTCCYAASEKHWITDPQGIAWEHFHTLGNIPVFSQNAAVASASPASASACCAPAPAAVQPAVVGGCTPRGKPIAIAVKGANPSSCC
jgi:lactoylglutathione lyase